LAKAWLRPIAPCRGDTTSPPGTTAVPIVQRQRSKCLRTARFKYVFSGLGERVNVAGDPAYHDELDRLERRLLDRMLRTERNARNSGGSANALDEEIDYFGRPRLSF
jgi:hypothetical protein